jgi:hypothetical protein
MGQQQIASRRRPPAPRSLPREPMTSSQLPPVWEQLAPTHQRQLAQLVAELIRRRSRQPHLTEACNDVLPQS